MKLTAEHVEAFAGVYLSHRYDQLQPTPDFHREMWGDYCSDAPYVAYAAPRGHAKSTAGTHDFTLANLAYRVEDYILVLGASEEMAIGHLTDISYELHENEELVKLMHLVDFETDQKTDLIGRCADGWRFRILARGAEQKIRGMKWHGKRPGLVIGDDLEDDEQVESKERREKFSRWFFRAVLPAVRKGGRVRVHGTILHFDSLLWHLTHSPAWKSKIFKAHAGFNDFSDILWPEQFNEAALRAIRDNFVRKGDSAGYSQEYLNDPRDTEDQFIRREWLLTMSEEDHAKPKLFYVGVDFAVSKADRANRTSFSIGGADLDHELHFVDQRCGRWDASEIFNEFFSIAKRWQPECFFVEDGVIWKAIEPTLRAEMRRRNIYLSIEAILPTKDKAVRARPYQRRLKAGGCKFDKEASWYADFENEHLMFTVGAEARADDQFDSAALLVKGMELQAEVTEEDLQDESEAEFIRESEALRGGADRNAVTGY